MTKSINDRSSKYPDDDLFFNDLINSYVESNRFVERHWLLEKIERHLGDPDCRIVLLSAEPGAGKTAFVAWLASQHANWLRYFIRIDSKEQLRAGDAQSFLFTVGHQLATVRPSIFKPAKLNISVVQNLGKITSTGTVVGISIDELHVSPFFQTSLSVRQEVETMEGKMTGMSTKKLVSESRLLTNEKLQVLGLFGPAQVLLKEEPSVQLVILIDALDELRFHDIVDDILKWLSGLAIAEIPPNIRFIISSRPLKEDALNIFRQRYGKSLREETIDPYSDEVQDDLYKYAKYFVSQDSIAQIFDSYKIDPNKFVEPSITKAEGNFQYLAFLYRGIEQEVLIQKEEKNKEGQPGKKEEKLVKLLRFENIPAGLGNLYGFFLDLIKNSVSAESVQIPETDLYGRKKISIPAWEGLYQPILGIMAVALESLNSSQIRNFTGFAGEDRWLNAALENLGQFLDRVSNRYKLYHGTFAEFLTTPPVIHSNDPVANTAGNYYLNPSEWHRNIIGYYRGTADRWTNVDWDNMDDYGLLNLSSHLFELKDIEVNESKPYREELYELICKPLMLEKLTRFGSNQSFDGDVELALRVASSEEPPNIVMIARAALLHTVLEKLSSNVPPMALGALALLGNYSRALGLAALISNQYKVVGYLLVGGSLLMQGNIKKAKEIFSKVPPLLYETEYVEGQEILYVLDRLGFYLVQLEETKQIVQLAEQFLSKYRMDKILFYQIATRLVEAGEFEKGLNFANSIKDKEMKARALAKISRLYAESGKKEAPELLEKAMVCAQSIKDIQERSRTLADISRVLIVFREREKMIIVANQILDEAKKANAQVIAGIMIGYAAQILAQAGEEERVIKLADEVSKSLGESENEERKGSMLAGIVPALAMAGAVEKAKQLLWPDRSRTFESSAEIIHSVYVISQIRNLSSTHVLAGVPLDRLRPSSGVAGSAAILLELHGETVKALDFLESFDDDYVKNYIIIHIVEQFLLKKRENEYRSNLSDRLLEVAQTIKDERFRIDSLSAVAVSFAIEGNRKTAEDLVEQVLNASGSYESETQGSDSKAKGVLLAELSKALAEVDEFDKAQKLMDEVQDDHFRVDILMVLIRKLSRTGQRAKAIDNNNRLQALFKRVHGYSSGYDWNPEDSWGKTALAWAWCGEPDQALEIVKRRSWSRLEKYKIQGDICIILAELGKKTELSNVANIVISVVMKEGVPKIEKGLALSKIAKAYATTGEFDRSLELANQIKIDTLKANTLSYIAQRLADFGDKTKATQVGVLAIQSMNAASSDNQQEYPRSETEQEVEEYFELMAGWQTEFWKSNTAVQEVISKLESDLETKENFVDQTFLDRSNPLRRIPTFFDIFSYLTLAKRWAKIGDQKRAISILIKILTKVKSSDNAPAAFESFYDQLGNYDVSSLPKYTKVWAVVEQGASIIAGIDQGNTLWKIYEMILDTERWYKP